jgi:hypothetical protein
MVSLLFLDFILMAHKNNVSVDIIYVSLQGIKNALYKFIFGLSGMADKCTSVAWFVYQEQTFFLSLVLPNCKPWQQTNRRAIRQRPGDKKAELNMAQRPHQSMK